MRVYACVRECVRACVRASVRACVRAYVRACVCGRQHKYAASQTDNPCPGQEVVCGGCGRTFSRPGDLKRHKCMMERAKPVEVQTDTVQCVVCQKWSAAWMALLSTSADNLASSTETSALKLQFFLSLLPQARNT